METRFKALETLDNKKTFSDVEIEERGALSFRKSQQFLRIISSKGM